MLCVSVAKIFVETNNSKYIHSLIDICRFLKKFRKKEKKPLSDEA